MNARRAEGAAPGDAGGERVARAKALQGRRSRRGKRSGPQEAAEPFDSCYPQFCGALLQVKTKGKELQGTFTGLVGGRFHVNNRLLGGVISRG